MNSNYGLRKKGSYETSEIALQNLVASRNKMYKKYDNLQYLKQLKDEHKFREMKGKNINHRRKMLERQKIANYKNELDRVNGLISQSVLKTVTHDQLDKRKKELKDMIENIN